MDKVQWPPEMLEREWRLSNLFDTREDQVRLEKLIWPWPQKVEAESDAQKKAMRTACIVASVGEGDGKVSLWQPVHLSALDDERLLKQVVDHMAGNMTRDRSPGSASGSGSTTPRKGRKSGG